MIAFEARASTVLYNLLRSRRDRRPFLLPANVCPIVPLTFRRAGHAFRLVDIARDMQAPTPRSVSICWRGGPAPSAAFSTSTPMELTAGRTRSARSGRPKGTCC